jgi:putative aminopeptidase FrvX
MDKTQQLSLIKQLSEANGISGFEDEVLDLIRREAVGLGEFSRDSMLNLYLERKGNEPGKPVVQLDCHTDEVGFMVKAIRPDGMLEFIQIGGWVPTNIPAHLVRVLNRDGVYIPGVVGSKPPHFMSAEEAKKPLDISSMFIDVGAASMDEVINDYRIGIAAPVVPEAVCTYDERHDILVGKAFDNRMGCAAVIATLDALKDEKLSVNLVGAFASQEEVGTRGAIVTSRTVKASVAMVFEGCPADDTVVPAYVSQTAIKKGPMLRHIDARLITNPRFQRYALDLAAKLGIPVQEAVRSGGSTNGASIHLANSGIPVIVIGIPVRYAHTHYGICAYSDYDNGVKLAVELLKRLDAPAIAGF